MYVTRLVGSAGSFVPLLTMQAASVVQAHFRRVRSQRLAWERLGAVLLLQAVARGMLARIDYCTKWLCAVLIQCAVRGMQARRIPAVVARRLEKERKQLELIVQAEAANILRGVSFILDAKRQRAGHDRVPFCSLNTHSSLVHDSSAVGRRMAGVKIQSLIRGAHCRKCLAMQRKMATRVQVADS